VLDACSERFDQVLIDSPPVGPVTDPALIAASTLTLGVGVGKELYDHHSYGHFSVKDLTWDVAGNAAAATVLANTR